MTSQAGTRVPRSAALPLRGAALAGLAAIGWLLAVAAVAAGVGALYLLRDTRLLDVGPSLGGALPLQQLAGGESQPLARMAVAWIPAGLVAGAALVTLTRLRPAPRLVLLGCLGAILLIGAGAIADAAAISDPISGHLLAQLGRAGTWTAVFLLLAGAALASRLVGAEPNGINHTVEDPPGP